MTSDRSQQSSFKSSVDLGDSVVFPLCWCAFVSGVKAPNTNTHYVSHQDEFSVSGLTLLNSEDLFCGRLEDVGLFVDGSWIYQRENKPSVGAHTE